MNTIINAFINFSLFTASIISCVLGINNAINEKGNRLTRTYFLWQGFFLACWCGGYAIMGTCTTCAGALFFRNMGLFGVLSFVTAETYFLVYATGIYYKYKKCILTITTIITTLDFILFAHGRNVDFVFTSNRTSYYAVNGFARSFHNCVVASLFIMLFILGILWQKKSVLEREKKTINAMFLSNIFIVLCSLPDTFLPLLNIPSIPTSGYGAFITYVITYYVAVKKNAFQFSQQNLGKYIYQYVNTPVLVFNEHNRLTSSNDYALNFLSLDSAHQQLLGELFDISDEDSENIFSALENEIGKTYKLIAHESRKNCALTFTMILDDYGKPYCSICFVYDLTRESTLLQELTDVKYQLEQQLDKKSKQVKRMNLQTIMTIANTIDARDEYTKGHSVRVAEYSGLLATSLGWSEENIQNLRYVALLHDIGKIGIPDSILNKPGKLSSVEYGLIQSHTTIGDEIVKDISMIPHLRESVRSHHERWDGAGYPDQLKGEEIPQVAQIISIADSFDAMRSNRVYRSHLDDFEIGHQLSLGRGSQFSPIFLDHFLELFQDGKLNLPDQEISSEDAFENESSRLFERVINNYNSDETEHDYLTLLLNRKSGEKLIISEMKKSGGCLAFIDLDNLKYVNDIYGHLAGDYVLKLVGTVLSEQCAGMINVRLGGDEFLVFMPGANTPQAVSNIEGIFMSFQKQKEQEDFTKHTSLSAGLYLCTPDTLYEDALLRADKALYHVKQNGKHGYYFYSDKSSQNKNESSIDLQNLIRALQLQGNYQGAYNVNYREFANIYKFISSMAIRYDYKIEILIITMKPEANTFFSLEQEEAALFCLEKAINETLRTVDVCTRFSSTQLLLILTHTEQKYVDAITQRIFNRFFRIYAKDDIVLSYDVAEYCEPIK